MWWKIGKCRRGRGQPNFSRISSLHSNGQKHLTNAYSAWPFPPELAESCRCVISGIYQGRSDLGACHTFQPINCPVARPKFHLSDIWRIWSLGSSGRFEILGVLECWREFGLGDFCKRNRPISAKSKVPSKSFIKPRNQNPCDLQICVRASGMAASCDPLSWSRGQTNRIRKMLHKNR